MTPRLLILGGTGEAVALADAAAASFGSKLVIISALAGRTSRPRTPAGRLRVGGFGGAAGLAEYLRDERIDVLIDATHPFAAIISNHAAEACALTGTPRLALVRPSWWPEPGDRWRMVGDIDEAVEAARRSGVRRIFLTLGQRGFAPFAAIEGAWFLLRLIEPPPAPISLPNHQLILARGPFTPEAERTLLREHRIDLLVSRASGGVATAAKLVAARQIGLQVILIERPPSPPGDSVSTIEDALGWLAARFRL